MATYAAFLRKLQIIDLIAMAGPIIDANTSELLQVQKDQLFQGVDNQGNKLMSILDDPFFKTKQKAWDYAVWKEKIAQRYGFLTPFAQPNLFINGFTHDTIYIQRNGSMITTLATAPWAGSIAQKYGGREFGFNNDSHSYIWNKIIKPDELRTVSRLLGCKIITR